MSARILTAATVAVAFSFTLPAKAADPQLVSLIMPDAKVVAGANVDQAKTSPFGQYVLMQIQASQSQELQNIINLTGFDPTRDVHELLVASNGTPGDHSGLVAARGAFDPSRITAAATADGGTTESYKGLTIVEDPKKTHGVAFLSTSLVVAGDVPDVKAAIDRQTSPAPIPAALAVQINQWSGSEDAWVISTVPPSSLHPPSTAPKVPGMNGQGAFQTVQSASAGVKFGDIVVVTAQALADNAQDAESMANALKLLASLAQMQATKDPAAAELAQSLKVTTSGSTLNVSISLPEDQLQQLMKPSVKVHRSERAIQ